MIDGSFTHEEPAVPAIDPNLPAASTPTANRTAQAATGYLK